MRLDNNNKSCDVIVTYCWNRVGYNILRSLKSHGLNVWVADTSSSNICTFSKFCSGSFVYPDPFTREEEFVDELVARVETLRPRVLLPTHDEGIIIARHRKRFPDWLVIPVASHELLCRLSDKLQATRLAESLDIPVPKIFGNADEIVHYPVVLKTLIGNSAKGVHIVKEAVHLQLLRESMWPTPHMVQEYVGGCDYSVDCVRHGAFFCASVYRALLTKTGGGGTTTQREIVDEPCLVGYAKRLLDAVGYNGVCGFDFRCDDATGRVAFIEVNARYTGGLATPVAAGMDIPWIHYCLATTGQYNGSAEVKAGVRTKWLLGDVIALVGRLLSCSLSWKECRDIMRMSGFAAYDDYRKDDKKAILGEAIYYLHKLFVNRKLNP